MFFSPRIFDEFLLRVLVSPTVMHMNAPLLLVWECIIATASTIQITRARTVYYEPAPGLNRNDHATTFVRTRKMQLRDRDDRTLVYRGTSRQLPCQCQRGKKRQSFLVYAFTCV